MTYCTNCGQEIADGAVVCKHCNATLGTPKRPTGVTVLAVLLYIGGVFSLIGSFSIQEYNSYVLGINVPVAIATFVSLAGAILAFYCGYGFLKLQRKAREIYLYWIYFAIANSILQLFAVNKIIENTPGVYGRDVASMATTIAIITVLFMVAFQGYILYYLIRRKDYFVN